MLKNVQNIKIIIGFWGPSGLQNPGLLKLFTFFMKARTTIIGGVCGPTVSLVDGVLGVYPAQNIKKLSCMRVNLRLFGVDKNKFLAAILYCWWMGKWGVYPQENLENQVL